MHVRAFTFIPEIFPENNMDKLGACISSAETLANTIGGTSGAGQVIN